MNLSFFFLTLLLIPPPSSSSSFLSFSPYPHSSTSPSSSSSPPSSSPSSSLPPLSLLPFLCPNPAIQTDNLNCSLDNGDFSLKNITFPDHLNFSIIEYNIDRNGFGGDSPLEKGLQNIIDLFKASVLITPDFLILSEVARDCKSYGNYIDGAFEIAKSLNLYYVYGVEYILDEDTNDTINHQCTIGNAIMSKYKLDNPNFLRFERQCCKFDGRTGGRLAITASLKVDSDHELVIYSTHLESGTGVKDLIQAVGARFTQTKEIIKHTNDLNGNNMSFEELEKIKERINRTEVLEQYKHGNAYRIKEYEELRKLTENLNKTIIIAGDLNTPLDKIDLAVDELLFNTFVDGHQKLSYFERNTCPFNELSKFGLFVFDYVFMKSARFQFSNPKVLNKDYNEKCYGASDHYPIMVNILENSKTFQKETKTYKITSKIIQNRNDIIAMENIFTEKPYNFLNIKALIEANNKKSFENKPDKIKSRVKGLNKGDDPFIEDYPIIENKTKQNKRNFFLPQYEKEKFKNILENLISQMKEIDSYIKRSKSESEKTKEYEIISNSLKRPETLENTREILINFASYYPRNQNMIQGIFQKITEICIHFELLDWVSFLISEMRKHSMKVEKSVLDDFLNLYSVELQNKGDNKNDEDTKINQIWKKFKKMNASASEFRPKKKQMKLNPKSDIFKPTV